jgi:hypothetical protein
MPQPGQRTSWAQRNALALLTRRGRYLSCDDAERWWITEPHGRPLRIDFKTGEILVEQGAVTPSRHLDKRWFTISPLGRQIIEDGKWPE